MEFVYYGVQRQNTISFWVTNPETSSYVAMSPGWTVLDGSLADFRHS